VLAAVVWSQDTSWVHCVNAGIRLANTTRGFIQSVLLTMGIMMPETCWVNLLWINIYSLVICWFFLLLNSLNFIQKNTTEPYRAQHPAIYPNPEPDQFSPCPHSTLWRSVLIVSFLLHLGLPSVLFPSELPHQYRARTSPLLHTCHTQCQSRFY